MAEGNSTQDDEKPESDTANKESEKLTKDVEWRDKSEYTREQDMTGEDSPGFHPPCEHCGSTVFKQEITTTHYVECDTKGNFVDQDTENERDEVIYCDECGRKLSEGTKY